MRPQAVVRRSAACALAVLLLLPAACVTRTVPVEPRGAGSLELAPLLSVERFLRAANMNDIEQMARLFGTRDGPIQRQQPRAEVEQRMFLLASILRHQDFNAVGEEIVPGRIGSAVRIRMELHFTDRTAIVPFTVVQSRRDGWLVESFDPAPITAGR
jgi:hypothetical protein